MSKILLTKDRVIGVNSAEAERIELEWIAGEKHIKINESVTIKSAEIRSVQKTRGTGRLLDLGDVKDKAMVLEFESMLEGLKNQQIDKELDYYGQPLRDQVKFPGIVRNEILGGVHWTVVKHAIDNKLIARRERPYLYWAILDHSVDSRKTDISGFNEFENKLKALDELKSRRNYAQKMNTQSLESLDNLKESLMESTVMPTPADNGNDSEQF